MAQLLARRCRWRPLLQARFNTSSAAAAVDEAAAAASKAGGENPKPGGSSRARAFLPGATVATLGMLAVLQARRLYEEKQIEADLRNGIEPEFSPDKKASFMQMLPLRFISRVWGSVMSINLPEWSRPAVYKSWARAFHTDLEEVPLPLEKYPSLGEFFSRGLKEGARPIAAGEKCLVSPVDGVVMRYGRVTTGSRVEQVKGYSYSLSGLLGNEPSPLKITTDVKEEEKPPASGSIFAFWKPKSQPALKLKAPRPPRDLFYCVLYLGPGDYHRVHSPSNWCVNVRRHFPGKLLPVNARATRTIQDLYLVNERVVLEGDWTEGYLAMALVGATNTGSIKLKFDPALKTNKAGAGEPETLSLAYCVPKGEELATFNMGSTVVLVFEAPGAVEDPFNVLNDPYRGFQFTVKPGQRIKMGQGLGEY